MAGFFLNTNYTNVKIEKVPVMARHEAIFMNLLYAVNVKDDGILALQRITLAKAQRKIQKARLV
jgi:hypothetical protein